MALSGESLERQSSGYTSIAQFRLLTGRTPRLAFDDLR